jgi:hypothetical protein
MDDPLGPRSMMRLARRQRIARCLREQVLLLKQAGEADEAEAGSDTMKHLTTSEHG